MRLFNCFNLNNLKTTTDFYREYTFSKHSFRIHNDAMLTSQLLKEFEAVRKHLLQVTHMQGYKMAANVGVVIQVMLDMENQTVVLLVQEIMNSFVVELGTTLYMK